MIVKDKNLKKLINVSRKECPTFDCYWPRVNPGIFNQGIGYRSFGDKRDKEWLCGSREIDGCPKNPKVKGDGK
jgi:hypothetical protein